ncbi:MAG: hypothetical protein ACI9X0_001008, partial [Kiritimatiellia bacterium]
GQLRRITLSGWQTGTESDAVSDADNGIDVVIANIRSIRSVVTVIAPDGARKHHCQNNPKLCQTIPDSLHDLFLEGLK